MQSRTHAMWALLALVPAVRSQITTVDGFRATSFALPKASKGAWSGLTVLPNGDVVSFDGQKLTSIDPTTGKIKATLAMIAVSSFGTDVALGPTGKTVFFGESTTGGLFVHDLVNHTTRRFATLGGNYSFAFHPGQGERYLWCSAHPGFQGTVKVFRINVLTGVADLIAEADGYAGPIAIDETGALFFAPAPKNLSTPKLGKILRWSATDVLTAIGPKSLAEKDATVFARGFNNAFDLLRDGQGTFYAADIFSNATHSPSLLEIGPGGGGFAAGLLRLKGWAPTSLHLERAAQPFERFGRAGAKLWMIMSDFVNGKEALIAMTAHRPTLTVTPSMRPKPNTLLAFQASRLPANALAVWMFGAPLLPERPLFALGAGGLMFPGFGIILTAPHLLLVGPTTAQGTARFDIRAPNVVNLAWTTQVLTGPVRKLPGGTPASVWVTTDAIEVITQ